jgi:hypothetical protein
VHRAVLPRHDVWVAACSLRRDVQCAGALLGCFNWLPGRVGLRGRARVDHHGLAPSTSSRWLRSPSCRST